MELLLAQIWDLPEPTWPLGLGHSGWWVFLGNHIYTKLFSDMVSFSLNDSPFSDMVSFTLMQTVIQHYHTSTVQIKKLRPREVISSRPREETGRPPLDGS